MLEEGAMAKDGMFHGVENPLTLTLSQRERG
jgi:hypothetical protein